MQSGSKTAVECHSVGGVQAHLARVSKYRLLAEFDDTDNLLMKFMTLDQSACPLEANIGDTDG